MKKGIIVILILLSLLLIYFIFSHSFATLGFKYDTIETQYEWGKSLYEMGVVNFWKNYSKFLDYQFGGTLIDGFFYLLSGIQNHSEIMFVTSIRFAMTLFYFLFCYMLYFNRKQELESRVIEYLILFLSPAIWFTSYVWAQMDFMIVTITTISIVLLSEPILNKKLQISLGMNVGLMFLIKLQGIILAPVLLLFSIVNSTSVDDYWKKYRIPLVGFLIILSLLLVYPTLVNPARTSYTIFQPFIRSSVLSSGASNFWALIYDNPNAISISEVLVNPTNLSLLIVIFILYFYWGKFKLYKDRKELLVEASMMLSLLYFYIAPKMHSRYSLTGIMLIFVYMTFFKGKKYFMLFLAYLFANLAYFINQFDIFYWWNPGVESQNLFNLYYTSVLNNSIITSSRLSSLLYLSAILILIYYVFEKNSIYTSIKSTKQLGYRIIHLLWRK